MTGVARTRAAKLRAFEHSLPMEFLKAREAAMTRFRPMLRDHGVTEQQWRVIRALADHEPMDAGELAERSFLLAPSLTRILKHLEAENLVRRKIDTSDQRRSLLALTARGRRLFAKVAPDSAALYDDIESEFGRERLARLYELLEAFQRTVAS